MSDAPTAIAGPAEGTVDVERLREDLVAALRTIYDPEIPVNIYDLGLIYGLDVDDAGRVEVRMTLTAPGCPVADTFPDTVTSRLNGVPGVADVKLDLVWDPPWTPMSLPEEIKLQLGLL